MRKVLILTDGKAGHENQSRAFARALGCDFDLAEVRFRSRFHKVLSYVFDRLGVCAGWLFDVCGACDGADCAAVLGTGSGTFYAAKVLARKRGVKCGVVLYPRGYRLDTFDCILAPAFDRPAKAPNVIAIPANLVANDAAFYEKGVAAYRERTNVTPETAVILGGPNKCSTMSVEWTKRQLDLIFATPGAKAVTTSRRTPPEVEALVDTYPWDYKLLYSKDHFNPIPAFVKLAKRLYVSAESTGMLSEACTFGSAEVIALDNLNAGPHKFRRFVDGLVAGGYASWNGVLSTAAVRKVDLSAQFDSARRLMGL